MQAANADGSAARGMRSGAHDVEHEAGRLEVRALQRNLERSLRCKAGLEGWRDQAGAAGAGAHPRPRLGPADHARHRPRVHHAAGAGAAARAQLFSAEGVRRAQPDRSDTAGVPRPAGREKRGRQQMDRQVHRESQRHRPRLDRPGAVDLHRGVADAEDRGVSQFHLARGAIAQLRAAFQRLPERAADRPGAAVFGHRHQRHHHGNAAGAIAARGRTGRRRGVCLRPDHPGVFRHRLVRVRLSLRPQHQGADGRRVDRRHRCGDAVAGGELGLRRIRPHIDPVPRDLFELRDFPAVSDLALSQLADPAARREHRVLHPESAILGAGAGRAAAEQPHARARRAAADVSDRRELSRWRSGLDICRPDTAPRHAHLRPAERAGSTRARRPAAADRRRSARLFCPAATSAPSC